MQPLADAVPDELAHDRKPVRLDPLLDGVADVRQPPADPHLRDPASSDSRVTRSSRCVRRIAPHRHRHRRIAVVAVELDAHVERDDVAVPPSSAPTGSRARPRR